MARPKTINNDQTLNLDNVSFIDNPYVTGSINVGKYYEWGELALSYSILSDICKLKVVQALEDEDNVDLDEADRPVERVNGGPGANHRGALAC